MTPGCGSGQCCDGGQLSYFRRDCSALAQSQTLSAHHSQITCESRDAYNVQCRTWFNDVFNTRAATAICRRARHNMLAWQTQTTPVEPRFTLPGQMSPLHQSCSTCGTMRAQRQSRTLCHHNCQHQLPNKFRVAVRTDPLLLPAHHGGYGTAASWRGGHTPHNNGCNRQWLVARRPCRGASASGEVRKCMHSRFGEGVMMVEETTRILRARSLTSAQPRLRRSCQPQPHGWPACSQQGPRRFCR